MSSSFSERASPRGRDPRAVRYFGVKGLNPSTPLQKKRKKARVAEQQGAVKWLAMFYRAATCVYGDVSEAAAQRKQGFTARVCFPHGPLFCPCRPFEREKKNVLTTALCLCALYRGRGGGVCPFFGLSVSLKCKLQY